MIVSRVVALVARLMLLSGAKDTSSDPPKRLVERNALAN